jgi:hypothetical protein
MSSTNSLAEVIAQYRSRASWNERLSHWERPASETEEAQIERAASMVRTAISSNPWLMREGVCVSPQGSYYNNTNVRQEADMDLRVTHPLLKVGYASNIQKPDLVAQHFGISASGRTFQSIMPEMRQQMLLSLATAFGWQNLDSSGNKAIRIHKLSGSRSDVDVVPTFAYAWIIWPPGSSLPQQIDGTAILGKDGTWTPNFPKQHRNNGVAKRARTLHRFKKVVRSLKRLRDELVAMGLLDSKLAPSYLVECLIYAVEDAYFLVEADDRYDRARRVIDRIWQLLEDTAWTANVTEINGVKFMFRPTQAWTLDGAKTFVVAAYTRLVA